jgi:tRNA-intron endonuclease
MDSKQQDQLRNKGFGEVFNKEYLLNNLESLFLLQNNKIKIYTKKKQYDFSTFLKTLIKKDKKILTKYLIFRDLRSKDMLSKKASDLEQILGFTREESLIRKPQNMSPLD